MRKQIFITGAAGFIGFHTALALKAQGHDVVGYDNFNHYYSIELKIRRAKLLKEKGIDIIAGDICNASDLKQAIASQQTTHCIHLAAQAGVRHSLEYPEAYLKANIDGFLQLLEICRHAPELKLIYASSSSVYGTNDKIPFSVTDRTDNQASLYGVTKKCNELMATTYHHLFNISAIGLRFFTVYGPWGRPDMAYYRFAEAIDSGKPIDIYNQGKMWRDFTYIDDIVDGIIKTLDLPRQATTFNLGNHQPETLERFIEILEEHLGKKAIKRWLPMQPGDVERTYADIESSQQILGFEPKTSLYDGLGCFVDWFRQYKQQH